MKSIVHVIKHVNFLFYRAHPDGFIWKKTDNWQQLFKQKIFTFYTSKDVSKWFWEGKIILTWMKLTHLQNGCFVIFKNVFIKPWNYNKNVYYIRSIVIHDETIVIRNGKTMMKLILETSENMYLFVSVSRLVFFGVFIYTVFLWCINIC